MLTDDQLHAVFEMYDCKRDGVITQEEMKQFLQKCLSDEAQVATEFKRLMSLCDKDKDGQVTFQEFKRAILQACKH